MSLCTVDVTMKRISAATQESKVAVFLCFRADKLNCVFDSALATRQEKNSALYLGSFCNKSEPKKLREKLEFELMIHSETL